MRHVSKEHCYISIISLFCFSGRDSLGILLPAAKFQHQVKMKLRVMTYVSTKYQVFFNFVGQNFADSNEIPVEKLMAPTNMNLCFED